MIGCFLERVFVKLHLSLSGFSPEKNMLPPYYAHKVMQKLRTWWMDIKAWPCIHPERRMGIREWLWDTLALWNSFWASAAVSSRAGSMLTWITTWNFSVGSHGLPATVSCFRGTVPIPGPLFQVCPLNLLSTLTYTESKNSDCSNTILTTVFAFWTDPHTKIWFRQVSVKKCC